MKITFNFQQNHYCPMGANLSLIYSSEIPWTKLSARQTDSIYFPLTSNDHIILVAILTNTAVLYSYEYSVFEVLPFSILFTP